MCGEPPCLTCTPSLCRVSEVWLSHQKPRSIWQCSPKGLAVVLCYGWLQGLIIQCLWPATTGFLLEHPEAMLDCAFTDSIICKGSWRIRQLDAAADNQTIPNGCFDTAMFPWHRLNYDWCVCTMHLHRSRTMFPPTVLSQHVMHSFVYQWSLLPTQH